MLPPSTSCMESRPSSKSVEDADGWALGFGMKRRSKNISVKDSDMNIVLDPGFVTQFVIVRRLLITLILMDSLSNLDEEPLPSWKSSTTIVPSLIFNWWTSTSRWFQLYLTKDSGYSLSLRLSNGTTVIQVIQQALDCANQSISAALAKLGYTYVGQIGESDV